ncbi:MAG: hypothetical protein IJT59_04845 [Desulfovibrionaceae bacterium]|nr:hypothetical protein [Desulfovibrionaceae bacterium]
MPNSKNPHAWAEPSAKPRLYLEALEDTCKIFSVSNVTPIDPETGPIF